MLKRLRERHKERQVTENSDQSNKEEMAKLSALKKLKIAYIPYNELLKEGFFAGLGWSIGVTLGFVLISTVLVFILRQLGGLPLIGTWIADIVEETQAQLIRRTPVFR